MADLRSEAGSQMAWLHKGCLQYQVPFSPFLLLVNLAYIHRIFQFDTILIFGTGDRGAFAPRALKGVVSISRDRMRRPP